MGMDLFSRRKDKTAGEQLYFRANVWSWHPLWNFCCSIAPFLISKELADAGHLNDGAGLDGPGSAKLAGCLEALHESGDLKRWIDNNNAKLAALPRVTCGWCGGTGKRTDEIGMMLRRDDPNFSCNACRGKGDCPHFDSWYTSDLNHWLEFVTFLRKCSALGGFRIH